MSRIDRVQEFVENAYRGNSASFSGVDASEVASALGIWRNDASVELNRLCDAGLFVKVGKHPVKYFPSSASREVPVPAAVASPSETDKAAPSVLEEAFSCLIGGSGSLKSQIKMAQAAVLYPPNGLHTLINGETGVGKSLFAEEMWHFAVQRKAADEKDIPFIVFNCAEYADNPQLLLSQLFGHVKGAFTGATEAKRGLVELADGGILFLDEIHRLPPTGQEMFFSLLDRGVYRSLGGSEERSARLMIIGATSEDPSNALLTTFKRRMPVHIQIPNLSERSLAERFSLVRLFLTQEARRLNQSITITSSALEILLSYSPRANIGDLKVDLQLCCARSYLTYLTAPSSAGELDRLTIDISDLPQKVYLAAKYPRVSQVASAEESIDAALTVRPDLSAAAVPLESSPESLDVYDYVERRRIAYLHERVPPDQMERLSFCDLERYWQERTQGAEAPEERRLGSLFWDIVAPRTWDFAGAVLEKAGQSLNRTYDRCSRTAFALHVQQFLDRLNSGQIIFNPNVKYIKERYSREILFLKENMENLREEIGARIPEDEICFWAMFLGSSKDRCGVERVGIIVAAHGKSMASSLAEFANQVFSTNIVRAVDAPFEKKKDEVFAELCRLVSIVDEGKGVLILADAGSFVFMRDDIVRSLGTACVVLQNVSSALTLEATRIVLSSDKSLEEIEAELIAYSSDYYTHLLDSFNRSEEAPSREGLRIGRKGLRAVIMLVCASGIGSAKKLKEILLERIPLARNFELMTVGMFADVASVAKGLGDDLLLIIGTMDPNIRDVRFVEAGTLLTEAGLSLVESLLKGWSASPAYPEAPEGEAAESVFQLFGKHVDRFAPNLPSEDVLQGVKYAMDRIEAEVYGRPLPPDALIRAYMHMASLFDRLALGQIAEESEAQAAYRQENPESCAALRDILVSACRRFDLQFPESELYYVAVSLPAVPRIASA